MGGCEYVRLGTEVIEIMSHTMHDLSAVTAMEAPLFLTIECPEGNQGGHLRMARERHDGAVDFNHTVGLLLAVTPGGGGRVRNMLACCGKSCCRHCTTATNRELVK